MRRGDHVDVDRRRRPVQPRPRQTCVTA